MIKKALKEFAPALVIFAATGEVAFAQGVNPGGGGIQLTNPLSCNDLNCVVTDKLIPFMIQIAIPLTAVMALVGGFQMMTAAGNPEKFSKGRKTLIYAAIGFGVVLIAQGVVALIKDILGA